MPAPDPALHDTLLAGIQHTDPAELAHAQATIDDLLAQLHEENIPLTRPLKRQIRTTAQICLIALRATNATLGRDDGKANPAAAYSAASTALDRQQKALDDFDTLVAKERALLTPASHPATPEEEAKLQEEETIKNVNNLQIPIQGLAVHKQPMRLKALADALQALDNANQTYLRSKQPAPYQLPNIPDSLLPEASHQPAAPTTLPEASTPASAPAAHAPTPSPPIHAPATPPHRPTGPIRRPERIPRR